MPLLVGVVQKVRLIGDEITSTIQEWNHNIQSVKASTTDYMYSLYLHIQETYMAQVLLTGTLQEFHSIKNILL